MTRKLTRLREFAERGPFTEGSLRWLVFNEASNGLREAGAIVRLGRRVFFDEDKFDAWIESQNSGARTAA